MREFCFYTISALMVFPPLILFLRVFWNHLRVPKWLVTPLVLLVFLGTAVFAKLQKAPQFHMTEYSLATSLPYVAVLIAAGMTLVRNNASRILFTLLVCHSYADVAVLFSKEFYLCSGYGAMKYSGDLRMMLCMIAAVVITFPFAWMIIDKQIRSMVEMDQNMPYWKYLWSIPCCYLVIYRLCVYPGPSAFLASDAEPELLLPLAWTAGVFLTYFLILRMLQQTKETVELKEKLRYSSSQIVLQQEQFTLIRDHVEEVYQAKHDMRHHLLAMKGYLRDDDCAGAERYIDQMLTSGSLKEIGDYCENRAVSALLSHYVGLAQQNGIAMAVEVEIPRVTFLSDQDLCIIVGNLLENALEACIQQKSGQRFIRLKASFPMEGTCALIVKNSFEGKIYQKDGFFHSSKRNGGGMGIESVRSVAQRYHGLAKFSYGENVFSASVLVGDAKLSEDVRNLQMASLR